jgi:hypothetical protein
METTQMSIGGIMDKQNVIIQAIDFYSVLKTMHILHTQMKFKDVILSEISQTKKDKCCMTPLV